MGVCSKGGKKRNERVKVSSDSSFGGFTRRGFLANLESPAEIWGRHIAGREWVGETREEAVQDRNTTDLPVVRE